MFDDSQKYTSETINQAIKNVEEMRASMMGTEIYDPLLEILK